MSEIIHTDCRSGVGATVGLIDAIISIARVLRTRDMDDSAVQAALADLRADADVQHLTVPKPSTFDFQKYKPVDVQWGERLRVRRLDAGLSQVQLAEKSGLKQSHICRLEIGKHKASIKTARKLAAALGIEKI